MSSNELDDFSGFVRLRLIEDDYAVLRKFQHRSSMWTYLAAVIERLSMDFCAELWGRWRPLAMAERLGPAAVLLDRLVTRDGRSVDEAIELARTNHGVTLSEAELHGLWRQLPARSHLREADEGAAALAHETADAGIEDAARRAEVARLTRLLAHALGRCSHQDRLLLALRFHEGLTIAQMTTILHSSAATLHRRLARVLRDLQVALESAGISREDLPGLIGHHAVVMSPLLDTGPERLLGHVRLFNRDEGNE